MTTYTIDYMNGMYAVVQDGEYIDMASTYHTAEQIIASIKEAEYSAVMGGDALLIEAGRFAARGQAEVFPYTATNFMCACGSPATLYVHGTDIDDDVCQVCFKRCYEDNTEDSRAWEAEPLTPQQRPLLAQCAALLDSLLGGPVVGGGIVDELRRVRAALAREGW